MNSDRRWRPRPFYKSVFDALVLAALIAMIVLGLKLAGLLAPESGDFTAVDGDSLRRGGADFRLHGIDAPELHQLCSDRTGAGYACGQDARRALASLARATPLTCAALDTDRYGRSVARCSAGGLDIGAEMVRLGWAIAYRKHSLAYVAAEADARKVKRGLWQGSFDNPEDWRATHRHLMVKGDMGE